MNDKITIGL